VPPCIPYIGSFTANDYSGPKDSSRRPWGDDRDDQTVVARSRAMDDNDLSHGQGGYIPLVADRALCPSERGATMRVGDWEAQRGGP
jgi:hypothetical protein